MSNLVLIGMPACGKSTVGVVLAKTMGKAFLDTDLLIQEREGALLQAIINEKGNEHFKKIEEDVLCKIHAQNAVISTGGSAVYYKNAMEALRKNGTVLYIKQPIDVIESRLDNISTRGITMAFGETIKDVYQRRTPLYEAEADITIDALGRSVEKTIELILEALGEAGKR